MSYTEDFSIPLHCLNHEDRKLDNFNIFLKFELNIMIKCWARLGNQILLWLVINFPDDWKALEFLIKIKKLLERKLII